MSSTETEKTENTENTETTENTDNDPQPSNIDDNTNASITETPIESTESTESKELLSGENMSLILLFLAVYFVTYFVLGFFMNPTGDQTLGTRISRIVDLVLTFFIIALIAYFFFAVDNDKKEDYLSDKGNELKEYIESDFSPFFQVGLIVIFYLFIYLFRVPMKMGQKPALIFITESLMWLVLLAIIVVKFFIVVFDVNILDDFTQLFKIKKEEVPAYEPPRETKEVFNISNNNYTFDEAQAVCKAYGAELATYDQIEDAYTKGAEWCNYGWSANQMAFFPTQKTTWQKLQSSEKHKNNCGRPGVNGGYMGNPHLRFGINCYGEKPVASDSDKDRLALSEPTIPDTPEDSELANKIKEWKENPDKYLRVNSFNYNKWSKHE
jgi:ABC-type multidrug transport system fused ATPase/permease subunit